MTPVVFQKGRICLRLLIISALTVTLTGCVAPQQARQASLTSERVWTVAKTLQRPSQRRTLDTAGRLNTHTKNAKSNIVPASLSSQPDDKSDVVTSAKPNIVTKTETPQSSQPDDKSNVVTSAKPNIVTKTETPQSSQPDDKSNVVTSAKPNIVTKTETPQSSQPDDKSNVVTSAKPNIVTKTETPQSSQPADKSNVVTSAKPNIVTKTETPQSSQPDDKFDPVIKKAMATIAAKMGLENSASVELSKVKRAKKNALGKSIDIICGYVRGKNTSGADTGGRAFLYLVQEDEAYIDGYNLATSMLDRRQLPHCFP